MSSLSDAYNAVIQACQSPLISYNQLDSDKPLRNTIHTYYDYSIGNWTRSACCDCSSLMGWALYRGGYSQSFFACDTTAMWDYYMAQCGWQDMGSPSNNVWQPGDILQTRTTHTEMVYQGNGGAAGITMGAHGRYGSYANNLAGQVSINTGLSTYAFTKLWRDPNGGTITPTINAQWHQINNESQKYYYVDNGNLGNDVTNAGFPNSEQLENMIMISSYLKNAIPSITNAAIAGIIGNMIWESTVNPNCWQSTPGGSTGGYGLVQWDPTTKYTTSSYCPSDYRTNAESNGNGQMAYLLSTMTNTSGEWLPTSSYPYTVEQFYALTDPQEAASAFLWEYERAGAPQESIRKNNAQWVYDNMSNWGNVGWTEPHQRLTEAQNFLILKRNRTGWYI